MVSRDTHPHEIFVRLVRNDVTRSAGSLSAPDVMPDPSARVARALGASVGSEARETGVLARTTLVGYLLGEGTRFVLHSARGGSGPSGSAGQDSRVRFSFSRADGLAACAVSGGDPVGVAIESVRRLGSDPLGMSAKICSDAERELLAATPPIGRPWRLLVMWTLKEAIAKSVGLGHRFPLQRLTIGDMGGISARVLDALLGTPVSDWHFATWRPSPFHVVSVVVRSEPGQHVRFGGDLASARGHGARLSLLR